MGYLENNATANAAYTKGMAGKKKKGTHIDFYRKNGVPRVRFTDDSPKKADDKKTNTSHHVPPTHGGYGYQTWDAHEGPAVKKAPAGAQDAAKRRTATGVKTNSLDKRRAERIATGSHKGKYLGPDEFKGDISALKAWRKAGSPADKSKFAAKAKGEGWHGTKGKGQGGEKDWGRRKIDYATDGMGRKTVVQYEKRKTS